MVTKEEWVEYHRRHNQSVDEQVKILRNQGFTCVKVDRGPIPDIVAFKDGLVYAVEIKVSKKKHPQRFNKWAGQTQGYNDIMWIINGRNDSKPKGPWHETLEGRAKMSALMKGRKIPWHDKILESNLRRLYGEDWRAHMRQPKVCWTCGKTFKKNGGTIRTYQKCHWCSKDCWRLYEKQILIPQRRHAESAKEFP